MKKFKFFSFATNINGKKSSGVEDYSGYNNWRSDVKTKWWDPSGEWKQTN